MDADVRPSLYRLEVEEELGRLIDLTPFPATDAEAGLLGPQLFARAEKIVARRYARREAAHRAWKKTRAEKTAVRR